MKIYRDIIRTINLITENLNSPVNWTRVNLNPNQHINIYGNGLVCLSGTNHENPVEDLNVRILIQPRDLFKRKPFNIYKEQKYIKSKIEILGINENELYSVLNDKLLEII